MAMGGEGEGEGGMTTKAAQAEPGGLTASVKVEGQEGGLTSLAASLAATKPGSQGVGSNPSCQKSGENTDSGVTGTTPGESSGGAETTLATGGSDRDGGGRGSSAARSHKKKRRR